ncbi:hypothetical protein HK101_011759 [Irineochytrium annulatum]|nr:hypothetical protein HK101_011759 [Irineochytrium annulatum]
MDVAKAVADMRASDKYMHVVIGRDQNDGLLRVIDSSTDRSKLSTVLKGTKEGRVGYIKQNGSVLFFRFGQKSKELAVSRDVKELLAQDKAAYIVENPDTDLAEDKVNAWNLPDLPKKAASSESVNSILSPEEATALEEEIQRRAEAMSISERIKKEALEKSRRQAEIAELARKEENARKEEEQKAIEKLKKDFSGRLECSLSVQPYGKNFWNRRAATFADKQLTLTSDLKITQVVKLGGVTVADAEELTGARFSLVIRAQDMEVTLLADNQNDFRNIKAAILASI